MPARTVKPAQRQRPGLANAAPVATRPFTPDQHNETEQRLQAQFERLEQQFGMLKDQLRHAQKLTSLGTAAAMLAHEFNNLLAPIVGYAHHALSTGDVELMRRALDTTLKRVDILTSMSDRILGLAVNEATSFRAVALRQVIEDSVACLCRDLSKDSITLTINVDAGLQVVADPRQLVQVFFNLLLNARQAITHRAGRITFTADQPDEDHVAVHVADNGSGMDAPTLARVFDAFFTTKQDRPDRPGVGLGLSLCREIVEEHRGQISVESAPGQGTKFTILLPAAT